MKNIQNSLMKFMVDLTEEEICYELNERKCELVTKSGKDIIEYYNVPIAFDIETSSFYENDEKRACMYIWQFEFNGFTIIGRTWNDFLKLLNIVVGELKIFEKRRIIIYVHNLAYEFQFIRKWFKWKDVFATDNRKPVSALTEEGIEFRCSYMLSGYSLAFLGTTLRKYPVMKMVGDLDYSKMRNSKTPLTAEELKYCGNDVHVVTHYIQEMIEKYGDITKLEKTKTGFVRRYVRNCCLYDGSHKKHTIKYINYHKMIKSLSLSLTEYQQLKRAFAGGFTHANAFYNGKEEHNVSSYDFTSSYPAVMLSEKFPMSKSVIRHNISKEDFEFYINNYCCLFDIEFDCIEKTSLYETYISSSKCFVKENYVEDNGRIVYADKIRLTITEQDYFIIKHMYKWQDMKIGKFRTYYKGYLPKDFIQAILKLYKNKTTLKGVVGKEEEYLNSKELLNSCYGMCVTDIIQDENEYTNGEWTTEPNSDPKKAIQTYNDSPKRFLSYAWGIWITAYARRNLFTAINTIKNDYIYSDTDSVKILNKDKYQNYFDNYNKMIQMKLHKMCDYYNFDYSSVEPKTIKGKTKILGVWDYEGDYEMFKTLGAKRYMIKKDNVLSLTVSGLNKKVAIPYLKQKYGSDENIFHHFNAGLYIPKHSDTIDCPTGKQLHTYCDDEIKGTLTDYLGNIAEYHELSYIHLENADYSLSLSDKYIDYILGIREVYK